MSSCSFNNLIYKIVRKDMKIIICYNKSPHRKWDWKELEWNEKVVDVESSRDGPENWRILKDSSWGSIVEAHDLVIRIWSNQISLGLDRQRWVKILDTTRCTGCVGGVSIVWLAYAFMICVSALVSQGLEIERSKPVRIRNDRVGLYCWYWLHYTYATHCDVGNTMG